MQDKKIDRRVKYTKKALKNSLIDSLKEKTIENFKKVNLNVKDA